MKKESVVMACLSRTPPSTTRRRSETSSSSCFSVEKENAVPSMHRPRTRSSTTIWSMPQELLLNIVYRLHVKDLLTIRSTHPAFRDMIDDNPSVWSIVSYRNMWPNQQTVRHFDKGADHGNVEALIKLGVAYLYNEGLSLGVIEYEGRRITANGEKAAELFCLVESRGGARHAAPFTWLFMRPPWAASGACCKECVFKKMLAYSKQCNAPAVNICIARTLELLDPELNRDELMSQLETAANQNSSLAKYLLWEYKYGATLAKTSEKGEELRALRELREICNSGDQSAQLTLCRLYVSGHYGGYTQGQAAAFVRKFVQSAIPVDVRHIYSGSELTHSMRYILVDWLVEVASMKGFDSVTLHVAINVVDRFLTLHHVTRAKLQLLGVSAMVLCSRYMGRDIITIREAAWLTDNTYKYEDVVRMMGEITAVLRGQFRMLTSLDYTLMIGLLAQQDAKTQFLAEYLCELALLHSELSHYTQARIASACILLARLTQESVFPWSTNLSEFTGFSLSDLTPTVIHLHKKCFMEAAMTDHRDVVLQAVKQRYTDDSYVKVGTIVMLKSDALNALLGISSVPSRPARLVRTPWEDTIDLIASPSRKHGRDMSLDRSFVDHAAERSKAATPTPNSSDRYEHAESIDSIGYRVIDVSEWVVLPVLNESLRSGYEADREDTDDSIIDISIDRDCQPLSTTRLSVASPWHTNTESPARANTAGSFSAWQPTPADLELLGIRHMNGSSWSVGRSPSSKPSNTDAISGDCEQGANAVFYCDSDDNDDDGSVAQLHKKTSEKNNKVSETLIEQKKVELIKVESMTNRRRRSSSRGQSMPELDDDMSRLDGNDAAAANLVRRASTGSKRKGVSLSGNDIKARRSKR